MFAALDRIILKDHIPSREDKHIDHIIRNNIFIFASHHKKFLYQPCSDSRSLYLLTSEQTYCSIKINRNKFESFIKAKH